MHGTWEAMQTGCIPIFPKSVLDSIFEDFPVWLVVGSWEEVTEKAVNRMEKEFRNRTYKFEMMHDTFW